MLAVRLRATENVPVAEASAVAGVVAAPTNTSTRARACAVPLAASVV